MVDLIIKPLNSQERKSVQDVEAVLISLRDRITIHVSEVHENAGVSAIKIEATGSLDEKYSVVLPTHSARCITRNKNGEMVLKVGIIKAPARISHSLMIFEGLEDE